MLLADFCELYLQYSQQVGKTAALGSCSSPSWSDSLSSIHPSFCSSVLYFCNFAILLFSVHINIYCMSVYPEREQDPSSVALPYVYFISSLLKSFSLFELRIWGCCCTVRLNNFEKNNCNYFNRYCKMTVWYFAKICTKQRCFLESVEYDVSAVLTVWSEKQTPGTHVRQGQENLEILSKNTFEPWWRSLSLKLFFFFNLIARLLCHSSTQVPEVPFKYHTTEPFIAKCESQMHQYREVFKVLTW